MRCGWAELQFNHPARCPGEYRLDDLLQEGFNQRTGKAEAGFETIDRCLIEDRLRARGSREIARTLAADRYYTVASDKSRS